MKCRAKKNVFELKELCTYYQSPISNHEIKSYSICGYCCYYFQEFLLNCCYCSFYLLPFKMVYCICINYMIRWNRIEWNGIWCYWFNLENSQNQALISLTQCKMHCQIKYKHIFNYRNHYNFLFIFVTRRFIFISTIADWESTLFDLQIDMNLCPFSWSHTLYINTFDTSPPPFWFAHTFCYLIPFPFCFSIEYWFFYGKKKKNNWGWSTHSKSHAFLFTCLSFDNWKLSQRRIL